MFTPPPSPEPPRTQFGQAVQDGYFGMPVDDAIESVSYSSVDAKRAVSRRTKWAVIIVPLILILITGTTRYLTHPATFDILYPQSEWDAWSPSLSDWQPHKRHPEPQAASSSGVVFPSSSSSAVAPAAPTPLASQTVPPIPSTSPVLPTPFPQPFDSALQANFTTKGCQNFFLNMTNTPSFRSCRPFSLLVQSSEAFTEVS